MKALKIIVPLLMAVPLFTNCFAQSIEEEKEAIKKVIEEAYVGGAFNDKDTNAMLKGFHESFIIQALHEDGFRVTTLKEWMDEVSRWKSGRVEKDEHTRDWSQVAKSNIKILAVKGTAAVAQVDLALNQDQNLTLFFGLNKFPNSWMIVNQIFARGTEE